MKKRMQIAMTLGTLICMTISGCNEKAVTPTNTLATEPITET